MSNDDGDGVDSPSLNDDHSAPLVMEPTRCTATAWHGGPCKNNARPGLLTCRWHDEEFIAQAAEFGRVGSSRRSKEKDADAWKTRCTWRENEDRDKGSPMQCKKWAVRGTLRCGSHGGSAVAHIGEQHMEERKARAILKKLVGADSGQLMDIEEFNPLWALSKLAIEVLAMKDDLLERMLELPEADQIYTDRQGVEDVRAVMKMYERAVDRTSRLLVDIGRLNLDERLVNISERQGDLISTILEKVLMKIGLGDDQRESAKAELANEFRQIGAAS